MIYREGQPPLRYLCIVCWRTVSPVEGCCCGVPMQLAESDDAIVEELRRRARVKQGRPRRWAALGALFLSLALNATLLALGIFQLGPTRGGWGRQGGAGLIGLSLFVMFLLFYLLLNSRLRKVVIGDDVPSLLKNLSQ